MPIYDYSCATCGKHFEHIQKLTEVMNPTCPDCGSSSVNKLISTPGLVRANNRPHGGQTCCGREERCEKPPCSADGGCHRQH
jgi:putative FmdB family regulatory protein